MLVEIVTLIGVRDGLASGFGEDPAAAAGLSNTKWLAHRMFTEYLLPFEVAAVILTVAVIAAGMPTPRPRAGGKTQNPAEQSRVRAADRIRMVKMDAEVSAEHAPAAGEEAQS